MGSHCTRSPIRPVLRTGSRVRRSPSLRNSARSPGQPEPQRDAALQGERRVGVEASADRVDAFSPDRHRLADHDLGRVAQSVLDAGIDSDQQRRRADETRRTVAIVLDLKRWEWITKAGRTAERVARERESDAFAVLPGFESTPQRLAPVAGARRAGKPRSPPCHGSPQAASATGEAASGMRRRG
jgi:hypothetical protein